jgi:hypothetical protein
LSALFSITSASGVPQHYFKILLVSPLVVVFGAIGVA